MSQSPMPKGKTKESVKVIGRAKQSKAEKMPKYSNRQLKKDCPEEYEAGFRVNHKIDATHTEICKAATEYMRTKYPNVLFIHIANEGKRSPQQGKKLKDEGMLPGTYDYLLACIKIIQKEDGTYDYIPGMFIEVKTKKDKLSKTQQAFRKRALAAHYSISEIWSIDEFIKDVDDYLN